MIEFLFGAFAVLKVRADKIIQILSNVTGVPSPVVEHCEKVSERSVNIRDLVQAKLDILTQISQFLSTKQISQGQADNFLRQLLKSYRSYRREVDVIEENFVGHVVRLNASDLFFTQISKALWNETNLPDLPPIAVTNTSGYFCTFAVLGIVFSPPSCEHNLLVFPDLYHEFGHLLHQGIKIELFGAKFRAELASYILNLQNGISRTARPVDKSLITQIAFAWENSWAEEVACDTLATMMIGPAYGWCNLHLCLQSPDVYTIRGEHPSDEARTKHIIRILRRMGYDSEADSMENMWRIYVNLSRQVPPSYHNEFHPESVFIAVMEDVEDAVRRNGIATTASTPIINLFNDAWSQFLTDPSQYVLWEASAVSNLQSTLMSTK